MTGQNQRLLYWPLLRSGDFDVIRPGLAFYRKYYREWVETGTDFGDYCSTFRDHENQNAR